MRSVADQSSEPPGLHLVPFLYTNNKQCVQKEPESWQVFLVSLTDNGGNKCIQIILISDQLLSNTFWFQLLESRLGFGLLVTLGSGKPSLSDTTHGFIASFPFSYRPLLPLLSLISFSVLHSIDVISSSNRPLLFHSLIYSSLFLSLWFWRFYVFYHFYLKWFTSSFFVFTFSFLPSHFNLECLFCHIISLSFLLLSDCRSSSVNSASVKVLYK